MLGRFVRVLVCLCLFIGQPVSGAEPLELPSNAVSVETARRMGHDLIDKGKFREAIRVLERRLTSVKGDQEYLRLLADAYQGCIRQLKDAGRDDEARQFLKRLAILDRPVRRSTSPIPGRDRIQFDDPAHVPFVATPRPDRTKREPTILPKLAEARPERVPRKIIRGQQHDELPSELSKSNQIDHISRAEQAFRSREYRTAEKHYETANSVGHSLSSHAKHRWAYCKLHRVTEALNAMGPETGSFAELEKETAEASRLAPRLKFADTLLHEIRSRSRGAGRVHKKIHFDPPKSEHFQVHSEDVELARDILTIAEKTRAAVIARWFGADGGPRWTDRCDIFVHANGEDYSHKTGLSPTSPGHSSVEADRASAARIVKREIHLRADAKDLLIAVVPHEVTHAVIAGRFGDKPLPRWADEGIAVLSEPQQKIDRHLRTARRTDPDRRFKAGELMSYRNTRRQGYPPAGRLRAFYAGSVSLVQYLSEKRGPAVFVRFLRYSLEQGYDAGLRKYYGLDSEAALDSEWRASQ